MAEFRIDTRKSAYEHLSPQYPPKWLAGVTNSNYQHAISYYAAKKQQFMSFLNTKLNAVDAQVDAEGFFAAIGNELKEKVMYQQTDNKYVSAQQVEAIIRSIYTKNGAQQALDYINSVKHYLNNGLKQKTTELTQ